MNIDKILPVYNRSKLCFSHGYGANLFTKDGVRYLDFASGIAVNALGHCHPDVVNALKEQADKLWHVSNLYEIPEMEKLATILTDHSFADMVFFTNSGTEAVECAIKMVRKYNYARGKPDRHNIITFTGGYHGRTMAALSASDRANAKEGFEPLLTGFSKVEFNNIQAVKEIITKQTAAILIEPIQGEGGIKLAKDEFLQELRQVADQHDLILIFDEIQCGLSRTGKLFACEYAGVVPDIMTISKSLGNGFPLGACLAKRQVAECMTIGSHGSTFGGNPLAMSVGYAVFSILKDPEFLLKIIELGQILKEKLIGLSIKFPHIIESIRGRGLMLGIKTYLPNMDVIEILRMNKLLTAPAGDNVVKIYPPLIISEQEIDEAIYIIEKSLAEVF